MNVGRQTIQRRVILEELQELVSHPTADEVYAKVRKRLPSVSLGTVYRNLEKMASSGEIIKIESVGMARRFDAATDQHFHVQCTVCGRVDDLDGSVRVPAMEIMLDEVETRYKVESFVILFQGTCPACASPDGRAAEGGDEQQERETG